jgi:hypothetical protein
MLETGVSVAAAPAVDRANVLGGWTRPTSVLERVLVISESAIAPRGMTAHFLSWPDRRVRSSRGSSPPAFRAVRRRLVWPPGYQGIFQDVVG